MGAAADLLRTTRLRAGLSQAELAQRAGVPRSVLSAYERAHRDPGAETLARLLHAAGFELRALPARRRLDPVRADRILQDVLGLAQDLPYRSRGLTFPPFNQRVA
jgi:transcriptional regulator with XRE-family HTH domain